MMFNKMALSLAAAMIMVAAAPGTEAVAAPSSAVTTVVTVTQSASASPAPAPTPSPSAVGAVAGVVTGACSAVAADVDMGLLGIYYNDHSAALAGVDAVTACNAGDDGVTPMPGANCTVQQSFCGIDLCVAIAFNVDQDSFIWAISQPSSKSVAMAEALSKCTEVTCASIDAVIGIEKQCKAGKPVCYIDTVLCGNDYFSFNSTIIEGYKYFDNATVAAGYQWSDNSTVTGTIANLNG